MTESVGIRRVDAFGIAEGNIRTEGIAESDSFTKSIVLTDPNNFDAPDSLRFLIDRNQESSQDQTFYLLTASYSLQFPNRLRQPIDESTDEAPDEIDEELMTEPETADDYWLDSDQIIESLSFLDTENILQELIKSRPFVTLVSFKEALVDNYQRAFLTGDTSRLIETKYVAEYLERFFSGLTAGLLNIGTDHNYKITQNKFKQMIISL